MKLGTLILSLGCVALLTPGCSTPKGPGPNWTADDARAYFEVLRSEFTTGKIETLNRVMKLTVAEADKFWPIYRDYEKELAPLADRKLAWLRDFLTHRKADTLNDDKLKELNAQWLQIAQDRLGLWKKYSEQISQNVSPIRAAQFLQVEHQMALYVEVQIASEMPLVGSKFQPKK